MFIKTRYFGILEVDPQTILFFPTGLPGFESCHRFKLFHEDVEHPIIHYLQALDDPEVVFSVVEPGWLGLNYELPLSHGESAVLKVLPAGEKKTIGRNSASGNNGELLILVILTGVQRTGEDCPRIRPLLTQPLIINPVTRRGIQLLLSRDDFDTILQ